MSLSDETVDMYERDIDMAKLKLHLQLLPDAIKSVPSDGISLEKSHEFKQSVMPSTSTQA